MKLSDDDLIAIKASIISTASHGIIAAMQVMNQVYSILLIKYLRTKLLQSWFAA